MPATTAGIAEIRGPAGSCRFARAAFQSELSYRPGHRPAAIVMLGKTSGLPHLTTFLHVQQKFSGTFRSEAGALAGTRLRSYLPTPAKQATRSWRPPSKPSWPANRSNLSPTQRTADPDQQPGQALIITGPDDIRTRVHPACQGNEGARVRRGGDRPRHHVRRG
jgi:hypothetical protein